MAHLLAAQGAGPGQCGAAVERSAQAIVAMLAVLKPGRPIWRSTSCLTRGSGSCSPMPRRSPRSPPPGWSSGWTGRGGGHRGRRSCHRHSTGHRVAGAGPRGHRLPHLHLGHHRHPEGGRQPPQPGPLGRVNAPTCPRRRTQCHSYAFDFSVWEIWAALLGGGRLVVVPEAVAGSPEDFHVAGQEQVNVLTQTPSAAALPAGVGVGGVAARW